MANYPPEYLAQMNNFVLHDRYFDPESGRISSYFCQLFILTGRSSVQYAILDTERNTFIALADYRLPSPPKNSESFLAMLGQLFLEDGMLNKKYPAVVSGIDSSFHTLVPAALYESGRERNFLAFNFSLPDDCQVSSDHLEQIDAYNIYGFLPGINTAIQQYLGEAEMVHRSSAILKAAFYHHRANPGQPCVYLNFREEFIDLIVFETNRLAFFNSFPCQSKEDVLYFTLYATGQLDLQADTLHLVVCGMIGPETATYLLLEKYIRQISFMDLPGNFNYSALLKQLPAHRYVELFNLAV